MGKVVQDSSSNHGSSGTSGGAAAGVGAAASGEGSVLESQIFEVGGDLLSSVRAVIESVSEGVAGPQALARRLGVDKVLTSRVLKATRNLDPMTATHRMPGPDPLRRLVRAAEREGADPGAVADAGRAIDRFEVLIRDRIGDRSLLDAILSSWIPEARREFELRRKQSVFKALSQLKGVQSQTLLATVLLVPSSDGRHIDVVWVNGLIEVHRVRPGVGVKISTRRISGGDDARRPVSIDGEAVETFDTVLLPEFCSRPAPRLDVHHAGEVVHYTLGENGFGPGSGADIVFAEANRAELARYLPAGSERKSHFFAEVVTPAKVLQFDVLVDEQLYTASEPELFVYDTSFEGVASVNDRSRDLDRLDMLETIEPLGKGLNRFRSGDVPRYPELLGRVCEGVGVEGSRLRGYRCRVEYPLYGSQVVMAFKPDEEGGGG